MNERAGDFLKALILAFLIIVVGIFSFGKGAKNSLLNVVSADVPGGGGTGGCANGSDGGGGDSSGTSAGTAGTDTGSTGTGTGTGTDSSGTGY